MATAKATNSVLSKLDKLEELLYAKSAWIKGSYASDAGGVDLGDDQAKSKEAAKWCLVGGVLKVGDGLQLYWEIALSCNLLLAVEMLDYTDELAMRDTFDSVITSFNDETHRQHREILKVIRDTRKRIVKKGLTPLPKIEKEAAIA